MIFSALALASTPAFADEPTGDWLVEDGAAQIHIENCGGALWGFVAWEKTPGGKDSQNPDESKRDRPTLGMPILLNMQPNTGTPGRYDGEVYNAQNGKTYTSHISLTDTDTLRIEGCVLGFLCGGQNWTRATPPEGAPAASGAMAPKGGAMAPKGGAMAQMAPKGGAMAPKPPAMAPKAPAGKMANAGPPGKGAAAKGAAAAGKQEAATSFCSTLPELSGPAH